MGIANVIQTIPSLAMISIIMLGLGLGIKTVVATVFLYSLLPIITNTYTGIRNVDSDLLDAAKGMGMTKRQRLFMVELPLSISVIMAGLRNALVVALGITAIGAFVGGGGLGDIAVRYGYHRYQYDDMFVTVALLIILFQVFQTIGMFIANKLDRRKTNSGS